MLRFRPVDALTPYAGYSLADLSRRGKPISQEGVSEIATRVLGHPDAPRLDLAAARIGTDGAVVFSDGRLERAEDEFCLSLGLTLASLAHGQPPHMSWLLDGIPRPEAVSWQLAHFMRCLSDPVRSRRTSSLDAARSLLKHAAPYDNAAQHPWRCFRGDPVRCGVSTDELKGSTIAVKWYRQHTEILASPVVVGSGFLLVVTSAGRLLTIDADNGEVAFELALGAATESTAAICNGRAYLGADDGVLYCIDIASGSLAWKKKLGAMIRSSPLATGSSVYVGTIDGPERGAMFCTDASKGKPVWSYKCQEVFSSAALVGDSTISFGSDDGSIHSLDTGSGRLLWKVPTGTKVRATPAAATGLYVGSFDGCLYSIAADGSVRWKRETGKPYFSSPAVGASIVSCGSHDGHIYAFDRATGEVRWKYFTGGPVVSSPVITSSELTVAASTSGAIVVLDPAGSPVASFALGKTIRSSPLVMNGSIFAGHEAGLTCLSLR
ncbi:MAG: PQQ-binding-like beta-propeller repeat protein [Acidobacteria bacterium]|nr:PQQ-binding-like beta-propeller repeat protein [Acidobacteriota bacterium]